jgi:Kef-type K+ transport system membrane component KefB
MIPQGEVSLIVAWLGVSAGIYGADSPLFLALFVTILLTTLLAPVFVRRVFSFPLNV